MKHNVSIRALVAIATLMLGSVLVLAHNGIEHVLGTVKTVSDASITVETVKHEMTVVIVDPATTFNNKGVASSLKELKVGDRVAINAKDAGGKKLHAISVKWGATITKDSVHKSDPSVTMAPKMKM